jgi:hypothetical protein
VTTPAAASLRTMIVLRSNRSTRAPAMGLSRMLGATKQKMAMVSAVAEPVCSKIQNDRAKLVMPVPNMDTSWPNQITVNGRMLLGGGVGWGVILAMWVTYSLISISASPASGSMSQVASP